MIDDLIYDVGMHDGRDTAYYLHRGFRVVAIEADPKLADAARAAFADAISSGRLTVLNVAIAAEEGEVDFWISDERSDWNSLEQEFAARDGKTAHSVRVPAVRFASLLDEHGTPHYLKVDIEGADPLCIDALQGRADLPTYVSVEGGPWKPHDRLRDLGYTSFKCISQIHFVPVESRWSPQVVAYDLFRRLNRLPQRSARKLAKAVSKAYIAPRYTRRDGWAFRNGTSGPFGEETAGRWRTHEEVSRIMSSYESRIMRGARSPFWGRGGGSEFWIDFHARR